MSCCCEHGYTNIYSSPGFSSLGYVPRSGIGGTHGNSMFSFLSKCQTTFHHGCTISHSHMVKEFAPQIFAAFCKGFHIPPALYTGHGLWHENGYGGSCRPSVWSPVIALSSSWRTAHPLLELFIKDWEQLQYPQPVGSVSERKSVKVRCWNAGILFYSKTDPRTPRSSLHLTSILFSMILCFVSSLPVSFTHAISYIWNQLSYKTCD
jgi:hypothetical protein